MNFWRIYSHSSVSADEPLVWLGNDMLVPKIPRPVLRRSTADEVGHCPSRSHTDRPSGRRVEEWGCWKISMTSGNGSGTASGGVKVKKAPITIDEVAALLIRQREKYAADVQFRQKQLQAQYV